MQDYSIDAARAESLNIIRNSGGINNAQDPIMVLLEGAITQILHAQNNNAKQILSKTDINNMVGTELDIEGGKYNVIRQQPSQAEGQAVFNITNISAQIEVGTEFLGNGNTYNAIQTTIGQSLKYGDISRDFIITKIETFATTKKAIIYSNNHGLASGITINGSGFSVAGLNGAQTITEFDKNSFIIENQSIVATTTITPSATEYFQADIIKANIRSVLSGSIQNIAKGGEITPATSIQYVNATGYVDYNEIGLGFDSETDGNYRARIVAKKRPYTTILQIQTLILNQAGITRCAIASLKPFIGNFTVYFLRDNDNDPIPTEQEITSLKNLLTNQDNLHATITESNVFVEAPTELKRRFVINGLLPNRLAMRDALTAQLQEIIYNIGIQNGTLSTLTSGEIKTQLIQKVQDSTGSSINNIDSIDILDTSNIPTTLALDFGEFISIDNISFA